MRDSAAGDDEVTMGMWRRSGPLAQEALWEMTKYLWDVATKDWEEEVHRSAIILLWKKKGLRTDLNKYRGISLLSIASRVIARLCAARLPGWAEGNGLLEREQWAFRTYRRTVDAAVLFRALVERGNVEQEEAAVKDTLCFVLADIEKAYPNVPHSLTARVLQLLGVPTKMVTRLMGLHTQTEYVVRTQAGDSKPYKLLRGLREGCPSSCIVFNLLHNVVLRVLKKKMLGVQFRHGMEEEGQEKAQKKNRGRTSGQAG